MKWWMLAALVVTVVSIADAAETADPFTIDLQMKSEARVPAAVLEESRDEVTRIFADAGIVVRWTDTAPRFVVSIVPQVLGYGTATSSVMGVAQRTAAGSSVRVFFKQVHDFARTYHVDLTTVLAYVIAHEVGHLLLPATPHSPTGLMQAEWHRAVVRDAARGSLTFTEPQVARIRAGQLHAVAAPGTQASSASR
jgi:hypothetical protein